MSVRRITRIAMIAAVYAGATLVAMLFLGWMSWGPIQLRVSEAITVLAIFTADAIPGLTLGCIIANVANIGLSGVGTLGILDVVFGSLATACGAVFSWRLRNRPAIAVLGPVIANALIVSAYLPIMLQGMGFYTIPFTSIDLEGSYVLMYLFGVITTGLGEALVMYCLGLPVYHALARTPLVEQLSSDDLNAKETEEVRS